MRDARQFDDQASILAIDEPLLIVQCCPKMVCPASYSIVHLVANATEIELIRDLYGDPLLSYSPDPYTNRKPYRQPPPNSNASSSHSAQIDLELPQPNLLLRHTPRDSMAIR